MRKSAIFPLLIAALCAASGIGLMIAFATMSALPLGAIPFATSIVLVSGAPKSAPARTRAIIVGHLVCAVAGIAVHKSGLESPGAVAAAVGLSVAVMLALDAFHPPAGITPLVLFGSTLDWTFLLVPVLVGAIGVAILARLAEKLQEFTESRGREIKPLPTEARAPVSASNDRPISP